LSNEESAHDDEGSPRQRDKSDGKGNNRISRQASSLQCETSIHDSTVRRDQKCHGGKSDSLMKAILNIDRREGDPAFALWSQHLLEKRHHSLQEGILQERSR
jgi:hypothetical protein